VSNDDEGIPASHEPDAARPNRRRAPRTVYASGQGFVKQNPQRPTKGGVGDAADGQEGYGVGTGLMSADVPRIAFDRSHATRDVKKESAGRLDLDLVRDNRMPGRGGSV